MIGSVTAPSSQIGSRPLPLLTASKGTNTALLSLLMGLLLLLAVGCSGPSQRPPANFNPPRTGTLPAPDPSDRAAIRAVLQRQARAWNRGDLRAYMAGYAQTDTLRFASGGSVRTGWEETLQNYRKGYPDTQAMGTLSFSDLDVDLLSGRHALVFGRWRLTRGEAAGGPASGLFTLLFEQTSTGEGPAWRIVHDHTSAAAE